MSDALKGQVPELESDDAIVEPRLVTVIADRSVAGQQCPVVGIMRSVLFDVEPEVEFRVQLDDALDIVEASNQVFERFELHRGERIVRLEGPFTVKAARIQEVDVTGQLCVLAVQLQRLKKA